MANPNIISVTDIRGNNSLVLLSTITNTLLINNPAASNKVYKINSIVVSNVNGSIASDITVAIYSQDDMGGTAYPIVNTVSVPANASLIVTDKNTSFYLKEDQSVAATAGTSSDLVVTASWEEIA